MRFTPTPTPTPTLEASVTDFTDPFDPGPPTDEEIEREFIATHFVNLTPHDVKIVGVRYLEHVTLPASGKVARVASTTTLAGEYEKIPMMRSTLGAVEGLPEPRDGVIYVVSALVRSAVPHRDDVASPGDLVRDERGNVVGCRGLVVN